MPRHSAHRRSLTPGLRPALVLVLALGSTGLAPQASAQTARQWSTLRMLMVEIGSGRRRRQEPGRAGRRCVPRPRHEFVPADVRPYAYMDMALPIGDQQTISPPFIVAWMTQQLDPRPTDRVLEIGTGSGYQAAVLAGLVKEVYTIEIEPPAGRAGRRDVSTGSTTSNIHLKTGDGYQGWAEHAPFDKIIVTCSPEKIPRPLVDQLREGRAAW